MPIEKEELEEILKTQGDKNEQKFEGLNQKVDELSELLKSLIEKGTKMPEPEKNQSSSSRRPASSSGSEDSEEEK